MSNIAVHVGISITETHHWPLFSKMTGKKRNFIAHKAHNKRDDHSNSVVTIKTDLAKLGTAALDFGKLGYLNILEL